MWHSRVEHWIWKFFGYICPVSSTIEWPVSQTWKKMLPITDSDDTSLNYYSNIYFVLLRALAEEHQKNSLKLFWSKMSNLSGDMRQWVLLQVSLLLAWDWDKNNKKYIYF